MHIKCLQLDVFPNEIRWGFSEIYHHHPVVYMLIQFFNFKGTDVCTFLQWNPKYWQKACTVFLRELCIWSGFGLQQNINIFKGLCWPTFLLPFIYIKICVHIYIKYTYFVYIYKKGITKEPVRPIKAEHLDQTQ